MSDMLTQDEINKLLNGDLSDTPQEDAQSGQQPSQDSGTDVQNKETEEILSPTEQDVLGEVGNICMGSAATVLHNLLERKVVITTPVVSITSQDKLASNYKIPYVAIHVPYVEGLYGDNLLIIKVSDVRAITSLLLGGAEDDTPEGELSELHLSAISEVMNQMMGSSATAMAKLINRKINISTPQAEIISFDKDKLSNKIHSNKEEVTCTSFTMDIEGLFKTEIMLLMDIDFSREIVEAFMQQQFGDSAAEESKESAPAPAAAPQQMPPQQVQYAQQAYAQQAYAQPLMQYQQPPMQYQKPPVQYQPPAAAPVNVHSVQFESFDQPETAQVGDNINLLMDVPLQVTVELGRTKKLLKDILDFNEGSVITLDKLVGESVDVVVNGKMIAKGEVVVADDNFAVRILDIVKNKRIV